MLWRVVIVAAVLERKNASVILIFVYICCRMLLLQLPTQGDRGVKLQRDLIGNHGNKRQICI